MRRRIAPFFLLLICLTACEEASTPPDPTTQIKAPENPEMPHSPDNLPGRPAMEMECYYVMNDKGMVWTDPEQDEEIEAWQKEMIETAKKRPLDNRGSLFSRHGGGPHGAEWNPRGDLLLLLDHENPTVGEDDLEVYMGEKLLIRYKAGDVLPEEIKVIPHGDRQCMAIRITEAEWMKAAVPTDSSHYALLFDEETIAHAQESMPLNLGEVLTFRLLLHNVVSKEPHPDELKKAIQLTYGE